LDLGIRDWHAFIHGLLHGLVVHGVAAWSFPVAGFWLLAFALVNIAWLYQNGQSIGKKIMDIKIVRVSGERCALWRILVLRAFVNGLPRYIPFVGSFYALADPLLIFGESRRCIHDYIADTIVIQAGGEVEVAAKKRLPGNF
jgi:uncharacterized RDD family membrane protein YckC